MISTKNFAESLLAGQITDQANHFFGFLTRLAQ